MSKWKPWQQIAFLGYLLLLNLVIFGTLAFLLLKSFSNRPQPTAIIVAVPPSESLAIFATITPAPKVAPSASPTPIPPLNIPPAPIPQQTEIITTELEHKAIVLIEGSRSQARTVTPAASVPVPTSTPTVHSKAIALLESGTPPSLITTTSTPKPTYTPTTPTRTPQPTATPTHTPWPTATLTRMPTHTPRPTSTLSLAPQSAVTPTRVPKQALQLTTTSTTTPTSTPQPTKTSATLPSPTPSTTPTLKPTHSPTPTTHPTQKPTPAVVAAALKGNTINASVEVPTARLAQPDLPPANSAGLVNAVALTNASIALSWTPLGKSVQYRIYSDMGSGYGIYLHKADVKEAAFVDAMLRPGMAYSYRVTRLEAGQEIVLAQTNTTTFGNQTLANLPTQQPVSTPTVVAAPTALPPDAVLLGLLSDNSFTDEFNTLNIVGEVRNDSNLDAGQTDIAVTFYDSAGAAIGTANGETMLDVIPPGEISPFLLTLSRPPGMVSYSLRAVARPAEPELNAQLSVVEVKRYEDEAGFFHIRGVVKNTGSVVAKRTKVVAIIYGRGGAVINVGFTYLTPPTLAPGEQARYEVIFTYYPKYVSQKVIPFEE